MVKPSDPRQLTLDLLPRSICSVQVAAVIADKRGIFSWGWNSVGSGFGEHAEVAAIRRANKRRLRGATIYVATQRMRSFGPKMVNSMPCFGCEALIMKRGLNVVYRDARGIWYG